MTYTGFYGGDNTPCNVLTVTNYDGSVWYCVEGSEMVNCTDDGIDDGVDVELLNDFDCFTWSGPINDVDELEAAIDA